MVSIVSESEEIVIKHYFKDPCISLDQLASILENYRQEKDSNDQRIKSNVDVRSVSKFKSLGLKKIRKGLQEQAKSLKLDLTLQPHYDFDGNTLNKEDIQNLKKWGGILIGFDYRVNSQVYVIYTINQGVVVYYEHNCNTNCQQQCLDLLDLLQDERNITFNESSNASTLNNYKKTIYLIAKELRACV